MTINTHWQPDLNATGGPLYMALAEALERDVRTGTLKPGQQLPTHRDLADGLGVSVHSVTRGYAEAERRGLVAGTVGRGTFVSADGAREFSLAQSGGTSGVEMGLATPLERLSPDLKSALKKLCRKPGLDRLLRYCPPAGLPEHRAAGAEWTGRYGLVPDPAKILVCSGSQHGLSCCLAGLFEPGDRIACPSLTYPGLKSAAAMLSIRLTPVESDERGLLPEALDTACRRERIRGLYLLPTVHNPTTAFMDAERREQVAEVAARHGLLLLEDDAYALIVPDRPSPMAALLPEQSVFLAGLSKVVGGGLRASFLHAPAHLRAPLTDAILNTQWGTAPLMAELAAGWIADGTTEEQLRVKGEESRKRTRMAEAILTGHRFHGPQEAYFLWLELDEPWTGALVEARARNEGVNLFGAERFAVGHAPVPNAVRLSLAGPETMDELRRGLDTLARILAESAPLSAADPGPLL